MPPGNNIIRHTLVSLVRQESDPPSYWRVRGGGGLAAAVSGRAVRGGGRQNVLHCELSCDEFKSVLTEEDHTYIMTHFLNNSDPFD
jgi:hypothetical protein